MAKVVSKAASKFTLPPRKEANNHLQKKVDEKKVKAFIQKGGKTTEPATETADDQAIRNFNIKTTQGKLNAILKDREKWPKPVGQKSPGISLNTWITQAIDEKLARGYSPE